MTVSFQQDPTEEDDETQCTCLLAQCIGIFVLLYRSISLQEMVHGLWNGYPIDMAFLTCAKMNVPSVFKDIVIRGMLGPQSLVAGARLGTPPCNSFLNSSITVCGGLLHSCISTGYIQVVAEIKELSGTSVLLKDGRCLEGIDAGIYSTGFETSFPYLEDPNIYSGELFFLLLSCKLAGQLVCLVAVAHCQVVKG